jgi:hypothetical protein
MLYGQIFGKDPGVPFTLKLAGSKVAGTTVKS